MINCKIHGLSDPAILCSHLADSGMAQTKGLGWVQAEFDSGNREPGDLMAWCADCDIVYERDGGWNDKNDSHFKVVCERCFIAIKLNQQKP